MNVDELNTAAKKLRRALSDQALCDLGYATGFMQRKRKLLPSWLAASVICTLATQKVEWIADLLRGFNAMTRESVQYKPFHNQLAKKSFPRFMQAVFERLVEHLLVAVLEPVPETALSTFSDIILQDGSSFAIADSLAGQFPGRFRKISPAAIEVHATMSVFSDNAVRVSVAPDSQGERDFLPCSEDLRGKLLLADRGYCGVEFAQELAKVGASFIIRFTKGINPTVKEVSIGGKRQRSLSMKKFKDIVGKLTGKSADLSVTWRRKGEAVELRLLAIWNPLRKHHTLLVTNLNPEAFSMEAVGTLYRLRWQVEHVFKDYKSYANLHGFCTGKAPIAEGLVWASLAAAFLKRFLAHSAQMAFLEAETSTRRAASALVHHLPKLIATLMGGRGVVAALRELLTFVNNNARRAHPDRDRETGRLQTGLVPVHASGA